MPYIHYPIVKSLSFSLCLGSVRYLRLGAKEERRKEEVKSTTQRPLSDNDNDDNDNDNGNDNDNDNDNKSDNDNNNSNNINNNFRVFYPMWR